MELYVCVLCVENEQMDGDNYVQNLEHGKNELWRCRNKLKSQHSSKLQKLHVETDVLPLLLLHVLHKPVQQARVPAVGDVPGSVTGAGLVSSSFWAETPGYCGQMLAAVWA